MQTENQPLIRTHLGENDTKSIKKPQFSLKWFSLVMFVTAVFIVAAIYHQKIGTFLGASHSKNSNAQISWMQIEDIEEKYLPKKWTFSSECNDDTSITLTLAIKQENVDELHDELLKVSDPRSESYGKHWTFEKVHEFLQPSKESKNRIISWLKSNGIEESSVKELTPNGDFIRVTTDAKTANQLLNTKYGYWVHADSGKTHLRVKDDYFVPSDVSELIDFISPTLRFPVEAHTNKIELIGTKDRATISADTTYVTPSTLKSLYNLGDMKGGLSNDNYQVVASFLEEWFNTDDLNQFWDFFEIDTTTVETMPDFQPEGYGAEAELDVQYITSTGEGVQTIVWDIEDDLYFISLLTQIAESDITPSVVSMSYGGDEQAQGEGYCTRGNTEFAKVSLLGITFFASSGDSGSISSSGDCDDYNNEYAPSFPASSVYVTAVGGTTGGSTANLEADGTGSTDETAWYYSGGGFSVYFDALSFQKDAVDDYFDNASILPDSSRYNRNGAAYPDLSAQSVAYVICYEGGYYAVSGTSCSCPAVAGMFALINDMRLISGKSRLGWINPSLYELYSEQDSYFNDITEGYNEGCSDDSDIAFYAQSGWDPITGLGTPRFAQLLNYFYELGDTVSAKSKPSIFRYRN